MYVALISKPNTRQTEFPCITSIFTIIFIIFSFFFFVICDFSNVKETPVGISEGSRVRLLEDFGNISAGSIGIVQLIMPTHIHVHILNQESVHGVKLEANQVEEIQETPSATATPKNAVDPDWPYWHLIRQGTWYQRRTCLGYFFCEDTQHDCSSSFLTFQSLSQTLSQPFHNAKFPYVSGARPKASQVQLQQYTKVLMNQTDASRLYHFNIRNHHSFLIEQSGQEFRIYQSWMNGFSLEYWTNPSINQNSLCEPGRMVVSQLMDPSIRPRNMALGITDDTDQIIAARTTYGCLRSIPYMVIRKLFHYLSLGYLLMDRKERQGPTSILPASEYLRLGNSNVFLGKSAIDVGKLSTSSEFEIEINFIEFLH